MPNADLSFLLPKALEPIFWTPQRMNHQSAWWSHVPFAFWIAIACRPRLLVELGTHHGVSYAAFCEAVARTRLETRCYAVDTWAGDAHAGFYSDDVYNDLRDFHKRYASFSELLRMNFDDACGFFEDGTIDLLHIDGYHTYEAVRHDFETWRPKLSERAVVLFHDTNVRRDDFGVWRFFDDLKKELPTFEFLHGYGLGVVAVGAEVPEGAKTLFGLAQDRDIAAVRDIFSHLGARWQVERQLLERDALIAQVRAEKDALIAQVRAEKDALIAQVDAFIAHVVGRQAAANSSEPKKGFLWFWRTRAKPSLPTSVPSEALDAIRNSIFFDAEFYLDTNPEVRTSGIDPAVHYLLHGGLENRDPGPFFFTKEYLDQNPDVAAANVNPLLHYLTHGAKETRRVATCLMSKSGLGNGG